MKHKHLLLIIILLILPNFLYSQDTKELLFESQTVLTKELDKDCIAYRSIENALNNYRPKLIPEGSRITITQLGIITIHNKKAGETQYKHYVILYWHETKYFYIFRKKKGDKSCQDYIRSETP